MNHSPQTMSLFDRIKYVFAPKSVADPEILHSLRIANDQLGLSCDAILEAWSRALELRKQGSEAHLRRVTDMTVELARGMGIDENAMVHVRRGALLHDIGEMAVPDAILLKDGPLLASERAIMRQHPIFAFEMLSSIELLRPALDIPYCHHEKWDGMGYPRGLRAEEIPLAARIFAVVDTWDALRTDRPYRRSLSDEKSRQYLNDQVDREFDPAVVRAFLELWPPQEKS